MPRKIKIETRLLPGERRFSVFGAHRVIHFTQGEDYLVPSWLRVESVREVCWIYEKQFSVLRRHPARGCSPTVKRFCVFQCGFQIGDAGIVLDTDYHGIVVRISHGGASQNRLARAVSLKTDLLQQPGKETANVAVVIAKMLIVVVVILAT